MDLHDVWNAVTLIRNADDEITAAQVPIEHWRFLLEYVQALEDRLAARDRLARLRPQQDPPAPPQK